MLFKMFLMLFFVRDFYVGFDIVMEICNLGDVIKRFDYN